MKCSLCGYQFNIEEASSVCQGCVFSKKCSLVRCPNCGFEMVPEPKWIEKIREKIKKNKKD
jgi:rubredoxin